MARYTSFNIKKKVFDVLKDHEGQRFTARQIAQKIYQRYPNDCQLKLDRSDNVNSVDGLIQQITREIGATWKSIVDKYDVETLEVRPREFFYSKQNGDDTEQELPDKISEEVSEAPIKIFSEEDLYPVLGEFAFQELRCFSMRIDEKASRNSQGPRGNHWLYPDVAGMIPLSDKWDKNVQNLAKAIAAERVHLVAFEVKKNIVRSNVREAFFQTVSNSSWANYSYLVAENLKSSASDELSLLCSSYGVGFILLDSSDPSNSQIKIPARLKENIDTNGLNRLATENSDATEFVKNVRSFIDSDRLKETDWDLLPEEIQ